MVRRSAATASSATSRRSLSRWGSGTGDQGFGARDPVKTIPLAAFRKEATVEWTDSISVVAVALLFFGTQETMPSADAALAELQAGNAHHVAKKYQHPHQTADRQHLLVSGQTPHSAILTCSDSRVPPEIVFDEGLGDIFAIRVAGNVAGDDETASIEY